MISVTLQRKKCVGCNYCQELCPDLFRMSKKDGKSVLLKSTDKKGFSIVHVNESFYDAVISAAEICPVKIIRVNNTTGQS